MRGDILTGIIVWRQLWTIPTHCDKEFDLNLKFIFLSSSIIKFAILDSTLISLEIIISLLSSFVVHYLNLDCNNRVVYYKLKINTSSRNSKLIYFIGLTLVDLFQMTSACCDAKLSLDQKHFQTLLHFFLGGEGCLGREQIL